MKEPRGVSPLVNTSLLTQQGWKDIGVSDPSSPETCRDFAVPGEALAVGAEGRLYVATQNAGLYVLSGPDSTLR